MLSFFTWMAFGCSSALHICKVCPKEHGSSQTWCHCSSRRAFKLKIETQEFDKSSQPESKKQINNSYLFLQHQALSTQILLKCAPLFHLWTGFLVNQDVVNALFPISEKQPRGTSWSLSLQEQLHTSESPLELNTGLLMREACQCSVTKQQHREYWWQQLWSTECVVPEANLCGPLV